MMLHRMQAAVCRPHTRSSASYRSCSRTYQVYYHAASQNSHNMSECKHHTHIRSIYICAGKRTMVSMSVVQASSPPRPPHTARMQWSRWWTHVCHVHTASTHCCHCCSRTYPADLYIHTRAHIMHCQYTDNRSSHLKNALHKSHSTVPSCAE